MKEYIPILSGVFIVLVLGLLVSIVQSTLAGQLALNFCFLSLVYFIYWRIQGKLNKKDVIKGAFLLVFTSLVIWVRYYMGI